MHLSKRSKRHSEGTMFQIGQKVKVRRFVGGKPFAIEAGTITQAMPNDLIIGVRFDGNIESHLVFKENVILEHNDILKGIVCSE